MKNNEVRNTVNSEINTSILMGQNMDCCVVYSDGGVACKIYDVILAYVDLDFTMIPESVLSGSFIQLPVSQLKNNFKCRLYVLAVTTKSQCGHRIFSKNGRELVFGTSQHRLTREDKVLRERSTEVGCSVLSTLSAMSTNASMPPRSTRCLLVHAFRPRSKLALLSSVG